MRIFLFDQANAIESQYLAVLEQDEDVLVDVGMAVTEGWTHPEKNIQLLHGDLSEAKRRNADIFYLASEGSSNKRQVTVVAGIGKGEKGINLVLNRGT